MSAINLRQIYLDDKYCVMHSIGAGHFGDIRVARNIDTNDSVAVKMESKAKKINKLESEKEIYEKLKIKYESIKALSELPEDFQYGFPAIYCYGTFENYNYLVMELLGYNLESLYNACSRKFTLKSVIMIGMQILSRLEFIHSCNIIYRDVKPENFVIGRELAERGKIVYMIDFGLAQELSNFAVRPITASSKKIVGTSRYMSINAHKGLKQSRRDDLESWAYVLIYFMKGSLPWQGIAETEIVVKNQKVLEIKSSIKSSKLCKGLPGEFLRFLGYIKLLKFEEIPNYKHLNDILNELLTSKMEICDWQFDWLLKDSLLQSSIETCLFDNNQASDDIRSEEIFCSGKPNDLSYCCGFRKKRFVDLK